VVFFKKNCTSIPLKETIFSAGFLILLCGMFVFTRWNAYHTSVYIIFLLPALLFIRDKCLWKNLYESTIARLYLSFLTLSAISLTWSDGAEFSDLRYVIAVLPFTVSICLFYRNFTQLMSRCLALSVIISAASAVYSLVDFYLIQEHIGERYASNVGLLQHTILASFVYGVFFLFSIHFFHIDDRNKFKVAYLLCAVIIFLYLMFAQSRGVLVGVFFALTYYLFASKSSYRWIFLAIIIAIFATVLIFFQDYFLGRGLSYRPLLWQSGFLMGMDDFWFGRGVWSNYVVFLTSGEYWDHPHNMLIKIFIDLGFTGVLLWLCIWGATCYRLLASTSAFKFLGISLLAFSVVATLFDGDGPVVKLREVWFVSWLPLMLCLAWSLEKKEL